MKTKKAKRGFTLAEVLITLTIIGVVAALTIPSLLANVNDKTYEQKRKGLQTRLAQAVSQMDSLNSYLDTEDPVKNSSMRFVVDGLSKVYKITNVCEFENFAACDFPENFGNWWRDTKYYTKNFAYLKNVTSIFDSDSLGGLETEATVIKTKNGESILLWYNPKCIAEQDVPEGGSKKWTQELCAGMLIDLDGAKKGPNSLARDIISGIILYPDTPYVALYNPKYVGSAGGPSASSSGARTVEDVCKETSAHGMAVGSLTVPTREHIYSEFIALHASDGISWSSTVEGNTEDDYAWAVVGAEAKLLPRKTQSTYNYCVSKETSR